MTNYTEISIEQIEALRTDAGAHGDTKLVATCNRAIRGSQAARRKVEMVVSAAAMDALETEDCA